MTDSLRIAMICEHVSPLATEGRARSAQARALGNHVAQVARQLAHAGHHVDVLTRRDSASLPLVRHVCPNLRVLHLDAGHAGHLPAEQALQHLPGFIRATERMLCSSLRYDVAHAHFFSSGLVAQRLKQVMGLPFVMSFHGLASRAEVLAAPARVEIEDALVRSADMVVAEGPQDRNQLTRLHGARPSKLVTVPGGYDPHSFSPMSRSLARQQLGLDPHEFIVMQHGGGPLHHSIKVTANALAQLPADLPSRLLVVGGDASRVAPRLTFTGPRPREELRRFCAAADVVVCLPEPAPSPTEQSPLTPLEAMACGTPVIGSAAGNLQDVLVDGVTGFLVLPHDTQALARWLSQLQANPFLAGSMGRMGAHRACAMYTWKHVASEMAHVYRAVHRRGVAEWLPSPPMRNRLRLVHSAPARAQ